MLSKGYFITERLKTESSRRYVVVLKQIIDEIKLYYYQQLEFFRINNIKIKDEYKNLLILNSKGSMCMENTVHRHWKEFKKKYNIDDSLQLHSFRRFFANWLRKNGISDKEAKEFLGHTKVNMTEYYQDDDIEYAKKIINKLTSPIVLGNDTGNEKNIPSIK